MKKRFLCMALVILMLCSMLLTSCKDGRSEEEIINDIVMNSKRTAYTVSIMIPTDADTSSKEFQERLAAVEEAINVILRQDCTEIKIIAVNDADYDAAVAAKMDSIKEKIAAGSPLPSTLVYTNKTEKKYANGVDGDYTIQLDYPDVLDTQVDIILTRNEADYLKYAENGDLLSWHKDLDETTGKYNRLSKIVKSEYLDLLKYNAEETNGQTVTMVDHIFGIPNNNSYTDFNYNYLLINKEVASQVEGFDVDSLLDNDGTVNYTVLNDFVTKASGISGVIPFYTDSNDVPGVDFWGNNRGFSLISSTIGENAPVDTFANQDYIDFIKLCKTYDFNPSADSKIAAYFTSYLVMEIDDSSMDKYHVVKVEKPNSYKEAVFGSVFAVTKYAKDEYRAKEILMELQTNTEIRTLLQYGIKGEDYKIVDGVIEMIRDNHGDYAYKMNTRYTGNGYITYPADGYPMEEWEIIKEANFDSSFYAYEGFEEYYSKISNKATMDGYVNALNELNSIVAAEVDATNVDEFVEFIAEWSNPETTNENVLNIKNSDAYNNAKEAYTQLYNDYLASLN